MASTEGNDSCVWQPAEGALRVIVRPRAASRMRDEALRRALERRGGEAGGLLLGEIRPGPIRTVLVEEVEPVPWPIMIPPTDRRELEAALAARANAPHAVVGYYRTHRLEGGLVVNAGDLSLIRSCFPDPANIFLLLKPSPGEALERRLFFWDEGVMRSSPDDGVAPWTPAPLPPPEAWATAPTDNPAPAPHSKRNLWLALPAIAAMLALLFIPARWFTPESPLAADPGAPPAPPAPLRTLGLEVRKSGEGLDLRWDRNQPAIRDALRGVLYIDDGPHRRVSELDRDQLRTGSIYYTPNGGDVRFRLEVHGLSGEPAVESVQVLAAGPGQGTRMLAASSAFSASAETPRPQPEPPSSAKPRPQADPPSREEPRGPWSGWLNHLRSLNSRYNPKLPEPRPAMVADAPPQLARTGETAGSPPLPAALTSPAAPVQPPPPEPRPEPRPVEHVPATPIFKVNPVILPPIRAMLRDEVTIGVRVSIDAEGKVTTAGVATRQGPVNNALLESAVNAARQWRFQPATTGGKPVPATMILNFRFTP